MSGRTCGSAVALIDVVITFSARIAEPSLDHF